MFVSIFTDELKLDVKEAIPMIKSWGVEHVDFRAMVFSKQIHELDGSELRELKKLVDDNGMTVGCLQTSLCKVHLPDAERQKAEEKKLEGIIRAADALDCRLVRTFSYWQPAGTEYGTLTTRPDAFGKVMDMFAPIARRAKAAGLVMAFENCGVSPDEVFKVLDGLAVPGWGLAWDVCNDWYCDERRENEDSYIERMVRRAVCVHVKAGGALNWLKREVIPYRKVLKACDESGLQGPVSAETHNPQKAFPCKDVSRQVIEVIRLAWPEEATKG